MSNANKHSPVLETIAMCFRIGRWLLLVGSALYLASGLYIVHPNEIALVFRLGKLAGRTPAAQQHGPGLHYALPYPIDDVRIIPVKRVQQVELTAFAPPKENKKPEKAKSLSTPREQWSFGQEGPSIAPNFSDVMEGPLPEMGHYCITGDVNIVHVSVILRYRIRNVTDYALNTVDPEKVLQLAAYSEIVRCIGHYTVDSVFSEGKPVLAHEIQASAQRRLDALGCGIVVDSVEIKEVAPPQRVRQVFQDVVTAYVQKETKIKKAQAYAQRQVPIARAQALEQTSKAQADATKVVEQAKADAHAFEKLLPEYKSAPDIVMLRLYRESLQRAFAHVDHTILVPPDTKRPVVILMNQGAVQ